MNAKTASFVTFLVALHALIMAALITVLPKVEHSERRNGPAAHVTAKPAKNQIHIKAIIRRVALENGIDPNAFLRVAIIESGLNPKAYNKNSGASGLFQFIGSTARAYNLTDPFDAEANARAAAALWLDNREVLRKALKTEPSAQLLYVAWQQGAKGALKLLSNPEMKVIDVIGRRAALWNGAQEDWTAAQFIEFWSSKFGRLGLSS